MRSKNEFRFSSKVPRVKGSKASACRCLNVFTWLWSCRREVSSKPRHSWFYVCKTVSTYTRTCPRCNCGMVWCQTVHSRWCWLIEITERLLFVVWINWSLAVFKLSIIYCVRWHNPQTVLPHLSVPLLSEKSFSASCNDTSSSSTCRTGGSERRWSALQREIPAMLRSSPTPEAIQKFQNSSMRKSWLSPTLYCWNWWSFFFAGLGTAALNEWAEMRCLSKSIWSLSKSLSVWLNSLNSKTHFFWSCITAAFLMNRSRFLSFSMWCIRALCGQD